MTGGRRRLVRGTLAFAALGAAAGVAWANAPPGQYATFDRSDVCITDTRTKLTWLRTPITAGNAVGDSFVDAATGCAALGVGWRAPSVNELLTLVDEDVHYELDDGELLPKAIDANAFPGAPVRRPYWTSSRDGAHAWAIDFQDGSTLSHALTETLEVRCVLVTPSATPAACQ